MYDHCLVLRSLSEFARVLLTTPDTHSVLVHLTTQVTGMLGLKGAAVSLGRGDRLEFEAGTCDAVADLVRVQHRTQIGPGVTAYRSGELVGVPNLTAESHRWPAYCCAATRLEIQAVVSLPMAPGEQRVGAMTLCSAVPRDWDPDEMTAAVVMADIATAHLLIATNHQQQVERSQQLQHALNSRLIIEQAKGMLAAKHQITPQAAFEHMRRHARRRRVTIRAVADAVVHHGMDV